VGQAAVGSLPAETADRPALLAGALGLAADPAGLAPVAPGEVVPGELGPPLVQEVIALAASTMPIRVARRAPGIMDRL
jgi:hypothetical protein